MAAEDITNEMTTEELNDEEEFEDEEDGMSSLEELFETDNADEDDGDEYEEDVPISKVITEIAQPVEITTSVGAEVDSKGQLKPNCKFTIKRNITTDDDEFEIMENDFESLIERVKMTIAAITGEN